MILHEEGCLMHECLITSGQGWRNLEPYDKPALGCGTAGEKTADDDDDGGRLGCISVGEIKSTTMANEGVEV